MRRKNTKRFDPRYFMDEKMELNENMEELLQKVLRDLGPDSQADERLKDSFRKKYARKANIAKGKDRDDPWGMQWVIGVSS